jgi:hypothetical protein
MRKEGKRGVEPKGSVGRLVDSERERERGGVNIGRRKKGDERRGVGAHRS